MRYSLLFSFVFIGLSTSSFAQKVSAKLHIPPGSTITLVAQTHNTMTQQAMGQAIDFSMEGKTIHQFHLVNINGENISLHHRLLQFSFSFDGMGQKRDFDSENKVDMEGDYGNSVRKLLASTYDLSIDPMGKSISVKPEKIALPNENKQFTVIMERLRELMSIVYLPSKGEVNIFHVLPDREVGIGDSWTESRDTETGTSTTVNTLSAITDSTLLIDFKTRADDRLQSEVNGVQVQTALTSFTTGQITLDRATGLLREKEMNIETNGSSEVMGSKLPISEKARITVMVKVKS